MIKRWSACPKIHLICPSRLFCRSMARNSVISWIQSTAWSTQWRGGRRDRRVLCHPVFSKEREAGLFFRRTTPNPLEYISRRAAPPRKGDLKHVLGLGG